ncbi:uncharacterized protein TNCV_1731081 [Trichonephila clavipes]|nr:uncharacterized protein TNCV_1731081 [Trichonephila clavipes]
MAQLQPSGTSMTHVGTHARASRSHFLTRQCSSTHSKDVTRLCLPHYYPYLVSSTPDFSPIEHIQDPLGWQVGQPTSLVELEARLQQLWNTRGLSQDIIRNFYTSNPARITSCIHARGIQQNTETSVHLYFFCNERSVFFGFLSTYLYQSCTYICKISFECFSLIRKIYGNEGMII